MAIASEYFGGELPGLAEALMAAGPAIGLNPARQFVENDELTLLGPFAAFSGDPRDFADDGVVQPSGFRGLIARAEEPIATLDLVIGEDAQPHFSFRGQESAAALSRALILAQKFENHEAKYTVRWLSLPDIYVTAVWLLGPNQVFVPTRLGSSDRPEIQIFDAERFVARVRELIAVSEPNGPVAPDESPRSGLQQRG